MSPGLAGLVRRLEVHPVIVALRRRTEAVAAKRLTVERLAADIDRHGRGRRAGLRARLVTLILTLESDSQPDPPVVPGRRTGTADLLRRLTGSLTLLPADRAWLVLAVLAGCWPTSEQVQAAVRTATGGSEPDLVRMLRMAVWSAPLPRILDRQVRPVQVLRGQVLVDVHHTAQADFATGIQRVTREVVQRWQSRDVLLVAWHPGFSAPRPLNAAERARACGDLGTEPEIDRPRRRLRPLAGLRTAAPQVPAIVLWRGSYLVPELAADPPRAAALRAMATYGGSDLGLIGYDLVPVTSAETSHEGMVSSFPSSLAMARHARVVAPISHGAAGEYLGWRDMLRGAGHAGPAIRTVVLPSQVPPDVPAQTEAARAAFAPDGLPLVLVVGSHEPRKNHLAVLHAAELAWREGLSFHLVFAGGNSWNSELFDQAAARLRAAGRALATVTAVPDALLFGAYRAARFTVFPSLNEGFGLPVAESLACGTPVITSGFGSMKEIADAGGGALLVDPRNDHELAVAMRSLLTDDQLLAGLRERAAARSGSDWDTYAAQVFSALTEAGPPGHASPSP